MNRTKLLIAVLLPVSILLIACTGTTALEPGSGTQIVINPSAIPSPTAVTSPSPTPLAPSPTSVSREPEPTAAPTPSATETPASVPEPTSTRVADTSIATATPDPQPMLVVESIRFVPETPVQGGAVLLLITVANKGTAPGFFELPLLVNDEATSYQGITVSPVQIIEIEVPLDGIESGSLVVSVGDASRTVDVARAGYLSVTEFVAIPASAAPGEQVTISTSLENPGGSAVNEKVEFLLDGAVTGSTDVSIAAGETDTVEFVFEVADRAEHLVSVVGTSTAFNVLRPEWKYESVSADPPLVFPNQGSTISVKLTNTGEVDGDHQVTLLVDGIEEDYRQTHVEAGASQTLEFDLSIAEAGKYTLSSGRLPVFLNVIETKIIPHNGLRYSVEVPVDWSFDETVPAHVLFSGVEPVLLDISVTLAPAGMSADSLFDEWVDATIVGNPTFKVTSEVARGSEAGPPGIDFEANAPNRGRPAVVGSTFVTAGLHVVAVASAGGEFGSSNTQLIQGAFQNQYVPLAKALIAGFKPPVGSRAAYSSIKLGFEIDVPDGWSLFEANDDPLIAVFSNNLAQVDLVTGYLVTVPATDGTEVTAVINDVLGSLTEDYGAPALNDDRTISLKSGQSASREIYTYDLGNTGFTIAFIGTEHNGLARVLYIFGLSDAFNTNITDIESIIGSFGVSKPQPFGLSADNALRLDMREIEKFDPATFDGTYESLFNGLVAFQTDGSLAPDLAESWSVNDDGSVYTFKMREGVKFHDGSPFTAGDVKFSWERALDPKTKSRDALIYLGDIKGARAVNEGTTDALDGLRVIDDLTLEVTLRRPAVKFIEKLASPVAFVISPENVALGKKWSLQPIGTGPFKVSEWVVNSHLILEAYENYHQGVSTVPRIIYVEADRSFLEMYEAGLTDITGVSPGDYDRLLDPNDPLFAEVFYAPEDETHTRYLGFNVNLAPFDDPKVREAFSHAIDVERWIELTYSGVYQQAHTILPPGIPGYDADHVAPAFDIELALALIAESSYGSIDALPTITATNADPALIAILEQNLGIDIEEQDIEDTDDYFERLRSGEFQLFDSGWSADYIDPENFLEVRFHSDSVANEVGYSNPEVDELLDLAAVETDQVGRLELYRQAEALILADFPVLPLIHFRNWLLVKPFVENFELTAPLVFQWNKLIIERP
ncbi:MAG: hypothetical protein HQ478_01445 [Chloroflexi bacterium]|nr:hypothetical protein [Chloroflexota bacterium]